MRTKLTLVALAKDLTEEFGSDGIKYDCNCWDQECIIQS